jgi:hypothetical protein
MRIEKPNKILITPEESKILNEQGFLRKFEQDNVTEIYYINKSNDTYVKGIEELLKQSTNSKIIYPATDYTLVAVCSLAFLLIIILAI